jgi:hypothetical protein
LIVFVEFKVLTAVVMKSSVFWDIMPCSPLKVNRRFGRTYPLNLQGAVLAIIFMLFLAWLIL